MKTYSVVSTLARAGLGLLALGMAARCGLASAEEILIRELDKAVDRKVLKTKPEQTNRWQAIPYQSEEIAGVMLGEGGGTEQQPITIRLGAKGTYRVYLGEIQASQTTSFSRDQAQESARFPNGPLSLF